MGDFFEFEESLQSKLIEFNADEVKKLFKNARELFGDDSILEEYSYRFNKYLQMGKEDTGIYAAAFRLEYIMNRLEIANEYYIEALKNGENRTKILKRLIPSLYKTGNINEGIVILKENIIKKENITWTLGNLIRFYSDIEKDDELFEILEKTIDLEEDKSKMFNLITRMYIEQTEYDRANVFIKKCSSYDKKLEKKLMVYLLVNKKNFKEAKELVNENELDEMNGYIQVKEKEYCNYLKEIKGGIMGFLLNGDVDKAINLAKESKNILKDSTLHSKSRDNSYLYNLIEEITSKSSAKKILGELILCFMYNPSNKLITQQIAKVLEKIKKTTQAEKIYRYICENEDKKERWEKYIMFSDRNNLYMNRLYGYISLIKFGGFNDDFKFQVEFLIRKNIFRINPNDDEENLIKKIIERYNLYKDYIDYKGEDEFVNILNSFIKGLMGEAKDSYALISGCLNDIEKIHCLNFALYNDDKELGREILRDISKEESKKHKKILDLYTNIINCEYKPFKGIYVLLLAYPLAPSIRDAKELNKYCYNNDMSAEGVECFKKSIEIFSEDIPLKVEYSRIAENASDIAESFRVKGEIAKAYKNIDEFIYANKEIILFAYYYDLENNTIEIEENIRSFINNKDGVKITRKTEIKLNNLLQLSMKLREIKDKITEEMFKNIVYSMRFKNLSLAITILEDTESLNEQIFKLLYLELYTDFKVSIIKRFLSYYREGCYEESRLRKTLEKSNNEIYMLLEELRLYFDDKKIKPAIIENKLYLVTSDIGLADDIKSILKQGFDEYSKFLIRFYCGIRNSKNVTDIGRKALKEIEMELEQRITIFEWLDTLHEDRRFFKVLGDWNFNIKKWSKAVYYYNKSDLQGEKNNDRVCNKYISILLSSWDIDRLIEDEYSGFIRYRALVRIIKSSDYDEVRKNIYKNYLKNNKIFELTCWWVLLFRYNKMYEEAFEACKSLFKIDKEDCIIILKKIKNKIEELGIDKYEELYLKINNTITDMKNNKFEEQILEEMLFHDLSKLELLQENIIKNRKIK